MFRAVAARFVLLPGARGETPAFTEIKHTLRDWIESRLPALRDEGATDAFARGLNVALRQAKLSCDGGNERGCPDGGQPGYLGDIDLKFQDVLFVKTRVGVVCGFDESVYAYRLMNGRWKRFWEAETNDYGKGKYVPLNFLTVQLSRQDYVDKRADPNLRLLLVLARDPSYCESNWYDIYYRVWQLRIDRPEQNLLLDGSESAFFGSWVDGVVSSREVLFEYSTAMTYTEFEVRPIVRHYVLRNGRLEREAPLALTPRDFVDEWMRTPWSVSSQWTSAGTSLQRMQTKENFEHGEYTTVTHCGNRPEHWQVALEWSKYDGGRMVATKHLYFLVRWLPPYRFSMSDVSERPWASCTERDSAAEEERTLFPIHSSARW